MNAEENIHPGLDPGNTNPPLPVDETAAETLVAESTAPKQELTKTADNGPDALEGLDSLNPVESTVKGELVIKNAHELTFRKLPTGDAEWSALIVAIFEAIKRGDIRQSDANDFFATTCDRMTRKESTDLQLLVSQHQQEIKPKWMDAGIKKMKTAAEHDAACSEQQRTLTKSKTALAKLMELDAQMRIFDCFVSTIADELTVKSSKDEALEAKDQELEEMRKKHEGDRLRREKQLQLTAESERLLAQLQALSVEQARLWGLYRALLDELRHPDLASCTEASFK